MSGSIKNPMMKSLPKVTDKMLDTLMDCHERELMHLEPLEASTTRHTKGLIMRGILDARQYITNSGKRIYALFVTNVGKIYLERI